MLNHFKYRLLGSNRRGLARTILVCGTLFLASPAHLRPSPPPRTTEVGQIVELVDSQGHRIYINSAVSDQPSAFSNTSARRSLSGSGLRTPDFRLTSLIRQAADRHQVDPDLIDAIVNVESGYDSRTVSPKGAMGLMQLIPATARRFGVDDPFDPKQNIEGGTSYLKYLLGLFDGNLALALAAYNAGEKSVLRERGIPPFPETREYVRKVRSFYQPFPASNANGGEASAGGSALGAWSLKQSVKAGKAATKLSAPLYTYVDGQGVMHIEQ